MQQSRVVSTTRAYRLESGYAEASLSQIDRGERGENRLAHIRVGAGDEKYLRGFYSRYGS